jgi:hypothetical protein
VAQELTKHLWEVKHPYYATEGCYFASGSNYPHIELDSWKEFLDEWEDADLDYNLVYRWDWKEADPDEGRETDELHIFFMGQRKARPQSVFVRVVKDDETDVIRWLTPRAQRLAEVWAPILLVGGS